MEGRYGYTVVWELFLGVQTGSDRPRTRVVIIRQESSTARLTGVDLLTLREDVSFGCTFSFIDTLVLAGNSSIQQVEGRRRVPDSTLSFRDYKRNNRHNIAS